MYQVGFGNENCSDPLPSWKSNNVSTEISDNLDWDAFSGQVPPRAVPESLRAFALKGERKWQTTLALSAVICAFLTIIFFPVEIIDDLRLDVSGEDAQGMVIESYFANRTLGDNVLMPKKLIFKVRFRFSNNQIPEHEATSLFTGFLKTGTEIGVEYLPSDPTVARAKEGYFVPGGLWGMLWSFMFASLPVFGVWNYRRWRRSRLALLVHGKQVPGYINRVWRENPHDDSCGWFEVKYAADGVDILISEMVDREIYLRACTICETGRPVQLLYSTRVPREHIVPELMS